MSEATTLTTWAAAVAAALRARGVAAEPLLIAAGLDPALLDRPGARYPTRGMTRFWELAVAATDEALPLAVPRYVQPATLNVLGQALPLSRSGLDALVRMARYSRLVTDAASMRLQATAQEIRVVYSAPHPDLPLAQSAFLAFMATAVDLSRLLAGPRPVLRAVELRQPPPRDPLSFEAWFGCRPRYEAAHNALVFDRALLEQPLPGADAEATRSHDAVARAYLARFDATPVSQRLRALLIRQLPSGEPTRAALADALHLTPRTLLRRLAAEHTNWKAVLNEVRQELAQSYLRQGRSAAEITWLLGFADAANFTRAFRRWTGTAPRAWQLTHGGKAVAKRQRR